MTSQVNMRRSSRSLLVADRIADGVERRTERNGPIDGAEAVAALERAYPAARLVVVELEDREFDVRLPGPVKRLRNAGADAYLTADSLDDLAAQLRSARPAPPPADRAPDELPESSVDATILTSVTELLHRRAHR